MRSVSVYVLTLCVYFVTFYEWSSGDISSQIEVPWLDSFLSTENITLVQCNQSLESLVSLELLETENDNDIASFNSRFWECKTRSVFSSCLFADRLRSVLLRVLALDLHDGETRGYVCKAKYVIRVNITPSEYDRVFIAERKQYINITRESYLPPHKDSESNNAFKWVSSLAAGVFAVVILILLAYIKSRRLYGTGFGRNKHARPLRGRASGGSSSRRSSRNSSEYAVGRECFTDLRESRMYHEINEYVECMTEVPPEHCRRGVEVVSFIP